MSFPRYSEYKDSGVEWLRDVPAHWQAIPLRLLANGPGSLFIDGDWIESKDIASSGVRYVTTGNVGEGEYREQGEGFISDETFVSLNCTEVLPKDILISRLNAPIARACIVPNLGCRIVTSVDNVIFRPAVEHDRKFLVYLMSSHEHFANTELLARGSTMQRISRSVLGNIRFCVPPHYEQVAIATFLNCEIAKIDAMVAEQERLIALLKEKRQAIISHAVTKGLNPDAPMKDSGVEWLGDIPAHWDVSSLKHIVSTPITDGPHETPAFVEDGIPFVSAEAVSTGVIDFSKIRGFITEAANLKYSQKYKPERNDIFIVKSGATTGVTAIVETDKEFNIWSPLAVVRCGEQVLPRFVLHFLRSKNFLEAVALNWSFGTQQNIGMGVIENLAIAVPPTGEQEAIVRLLDENIALEGTLLQEVESAIELLKERRSALISAAVTGKIDVRGFAAERKAA